MLNTDAPRPFSLDEVTAEWLSMALGHQFPGVEATGITPTGGQADLSALRARLHLARS